MNNRFLLRMSALVAVGLMTGCSSMFGPEGYFRDRGDDYLKADVMPPMVVPAGVEQREVDQLYVIPEISSEAELATNFQVPRPQSLSENAFTDRVKIQKLDDKRWILVSASPAEVWPQVRGFLSRNNLEVVYTDAATGIIETGWLRFVNDDKTQNKYRMRIEQGIQPDSTEIHVLHLSVDSSAGSNRNVQWPQRSSNPERENWMVDELAGVIASDTSGSQAASLLAQSIGFSSKVVLDTEGAEPVLRLNVDRARALATVTHALNQGGFILWEQEARFGVFYVTYDENAADKEEEPGFFGRLFGGDKKVIPAPPYSLADILANLQLEDTELNRRIFAGRGSNPGQVLSKVPGYLLVAHSENQGVAVRIRDGYGRTLGKNEAKHLLAVVRQNLI
ncbi:MAG: outer membrane protein assembly factor BamC [Gammaproteobacteria bacterium]|uniref:outer membrane protein assembly factor BamC n=1 Tax=Pseudomaricurvus alcaniphilus TaxID=1166482 RepID=UPI0014096759|nr:outer membrane protein assembly factor BamC [Pseudomaricurvus alcaniphilus]MBR9912811.1 outer membrane protein assembly factor BamC [Gammaproteobacteria bacterium]NHN37791.1 outer membrane protein assembly factor BamC [Pseudomaricurvus alcaniphilus]